MSPLLLGEVGDYLLREEKFDQAAGFYQRLLDDFPKSQMVDFAYNGLGEIAYQKKDYAQARCAISPTARRRSLPPKS